MMKKYYEVLKKMEYDGKLYAVLEGDGIFYQEIDPIECEVGEVLLDANPIKVGSGTNPEFEKIIEFMVGNFL